MIDELHPEDFDTATWDAVEELIDSGEYGDIDDGDPEATIDFDMDDNPFTRDEPEFGSYMLVRRFLLESGAEDDEIVTIHVNS